MAKTPQQNGVAERKKRTIQEMARDIIDEVEVPPTFRGEASQEILYLSNRTQIKPNSDKNPYEIWRGRHASIKHYKVFGTK